MRKELQQCFKKWVSDSERQEILLKSEPKSDKSSSDDSPFRTFFRYAQTTRNQLEGKLPQDPDLSIAKFVELCVLQKDLNKGGISWTLSVGTEALANAIAFANLLWPPFVAYKNGFFRQGFQPACVDNLMEATHDIRDAEAILNRVAISNLFPDVPSTWQNHRYLARILQEAWQAKLKRDFPDHCFGVYLLEPEDPEDPNEKSPIENGPLDITFIHLE